MARSAAHLALAAYAAEEHRTKVATSIERALNALPKEPVEVSKGLRQLRQELGLPDGPSILVGDGHLVNPVAIHRRLLEIRRELEELHSQVRASKRTPSRGQPVSEPVLFAADLLQRVAEARQPDPTAVVVGLFAVAFGVAPSNVELPALTLQWRKTLRAARALLKKAPRQRTSRSTSPLPSPEVLATLT
jgi:hypothetical protein